MWFKSLENWILSFFNLSFLLFLSSFLEHSKDFDLSTGFQKLCFGVISLFVEFLFQLGDFKGCLFVFLAVEILFVLLLN